MKDDKKELPLEETVLSLEEIMSILSGTSEKITIADLAKQILILSKNLLSTIKVLESQQNVMRKILESLEKIAKYTALTSKHVWINSDMILDLYENSENGKSDNLKGFRENIKELKELRKELDTKRNS